MWYIILISLRFMKISRNLSRHLFMNTITQVFQINILEIFKMWSFIFVSSKLTEIFQNFYKFQFIQLIKILLVSNIFVNFLNTQKEDHFIKSLSDEPRFLLSLSCINYQKSKMTFISSLSSHVNWNTLYQNNKNDFLNFFNC